jgi:hypothetical protein
MRLIIPIPFALLLVLAPFFAVWWLASRTLRFLVYLWRQHWSADRRGGGR